MKKQRHLGCPFCGAHTIRGWVSKEFEPFSPERRFEARIECWHCGSSFLWVYLGDKTTKKRDIERSMWQDWDTRWVKGGERWKK